MLATTLSGLRQAAAALTVPLQGATALFTTAVVQKSKTQGSEDIDEFIFREHCKGARVASKDAQEVTESLRRNDFGAPKTKSADRTAQAGGTTQSRTQTATTSRTRGYATTSERSTDDVAQELTEKGSKRLMQSDNGREELQQGSFDLDKTTERVLEEGKKEASPEAQAHADNEDVQDAVKSRIVSGSQTT